MSDSALPDPPSNPDQTGSGLSPGQTATLNLVAGQIDQLLDLGRLIEMLQNPSHARHLAFRGASDLRCFRDKTLQHAVYSICNCYEYLRAVAIGGQRLIDFLAFIDELSPRIQRVIRELEFMLLNPANAYSDLFELLAADVIAVDNLFCRATVNAIHGKTNGPPSGA